MEIEIVADGLLFPEGPVACDDGSLLLVEIARGTLTRIADGRNEVVAELGGGPNGAAIGPDGHAYVCNNGGRFTFFEQGGLRYPGLLPDSHIGGSIQRVDLATGAAETLYEACGGRRLRAPNDLMFDQAGGFWFTDHGTGKHDGGVFYAKADGSAIRCWLDGQTSPNGIGLSPDGSIVYVADTGPRTLTAYRLSGPGEMVDPAAGEVVVEREEGVLFDSLAVEEDGSVCVGTLLKGGVTVWHPDGSWEHVPVDDAMTTNICFGGSDMRDAWLALSSQGKIGRVRWPRPGLRLVHQQGA
jgi:gluconolactonase